MQIKNKVGDITEEQKNVILKTFSLMSIYDGKTLGTFISDIGIPENAPLSELFYQLALFKINWPFRMLNVTVEITASQGYSIPVLDDETVAGFAKGDILLDELDQNWTLENAKQSLLSDIDDCAVSFDYAVDDDEGVRLFDWDD